MSVMDTSIEAFRAMLVESIAFWYNLMPEEIQDIVYDAVLTADDEFMGL